MLRMKGTADMEAKIGGRKFLAFLSMATFNIVSSLLESEDRLESN
jgi:hypothetical protein